MKYLSIFFLALTLVLHNSTNCLSQGNCTSEDLEVICQNGEFIQMVAYQCGLECISEDADCLVQCMLQSLELSSSCLECFGEQTICVVTNCSFECLSGTETECAQCAQENCELSFNICAGIIDQDGDSWSNLCDCDDTNPVVFPGAEGTSQGFDNDCNGLLTSAELTTCLADVNGDNVTGTSDLLQFLGLFNCSGDCADLESGDFNGDNVVGTADLLILLSEFGLFCL